MALILVADDNEHVRNLLRDVLHMAGHQVIEAKDGEDALKKTSSLLPSLVILDIIMPNTDGTEVIQILRRERDEIKIIAISGGLSGGKLDVLELAQRFGATRTFRKPFDIHSLLDAVNQLLSS